VDNHLLRTQQEKRKLEIEYNKILAENNEKRQGNQPQQMNKKGSKKGRVGGKSLQNSAFNSHKNSEI
jgi:hypothetical protein